MTTPNRRVLSIGQCAADHDRISQQLGIRYQAEVIPVDSLKEATDILDHGSADLILINRILDHDGTAGLDVLQTLGQHPTASDVPIMLVSNYDDAQQAAVAAGAVPGFGKAALNDPGTYTKLDLYLRNDPDQ